MLSPIALSLLRLLIYHSRQTSFFFTVDWYLWLWKRQFIFPTNLLSVILNFLRLEHSTFIFSFSLSLSLSAFYQNQVCSASECVQVEAALHLVNCKVAYGNWSF